MRPDQVVRCQSFPCTDVRHAGYQVPDIEIVPEAVRIVLISESAPARREDGYYQGAEALFAQTTVQAFRDAGAQVDALADILGLGVYLTSAVKCAKTGYGIATDTVAECSRLLEQELAPFTGVRAWLLMGDVAIKAVNAIAKRHGEPRVIPAGATYKLRGAAYTWRGARAFPSYLQAGPSYFIEKSKRQMIAEDIAAALRLLD
ncbi:MAG: uracil-DNA glycosylase [Chloroflexi bacterium]|nr:uracil-DNA glycosylase [Chloroflexota bacterium]